MGLKACSPYTIKTPYEAEVYHDYRTFLAWSTQPTGGYIYGPGDIIKICEDLVLYAQWGEDVTPLLQE